MVVLSSQEMRVLEKVFLRDVNIGNFFSSPYRSVEDIEASGILHFAQDDKQNKKKAPGRGQRRKPADLSPDQ